MDTVRFAEARDRVIRAENRKGGIGTLSEKTLHAVLKCYYDPYEDNHEIRIGPYVADIVGEDGIVEIQTGGFDRLRKKLDLFLPVTRVTAVYPVAGLKWLSWVDKETGEVVSRRRSPRKGTPCDACFELYKIKQYLTHPNLSLRIPLLELEEYRLLDGWSRDKKRGSSRCERIPLAILDEVSISGPMEYGKLIPGTLAGEFTSASFGRHAGLSQRAAGTALNVLYHTGAVRRVRKRGNAYVYETAGAGDEDSAGPAASYMCDGNPM